MPVQVQPGQYACARVTWRNEKESSWAPTFRWDLRRSGLFSTWIEGAPVNSSPVAPGETGTVDVCCQVPNWSDPAGRAIPVDAKLCVLREGKFATVWGPGEGVYVVSGVMGGLAAVAMLAVVMTGLMAIKGQEG